MLITRRSLAGAAALALVPGAARAQAGGPVRFVVPFPPGGGTDTVMRLLQPQLQAALGQPVLVENRAGRAGATAAAHVARSAPDGRTFLIVFDTHVVNPALQADLGIDPVAGFTPVLLLGTAPLLVVTPRSRPWRRFEEVVAAARARPGAIQYGTSGGGSLAHVTMALVERRLGIDLVHQPYRGGGQVVEAAVAGEIDLAIATGTGLREPLAEGRLVVLAQTGATRAPGWPAVPTLAEAGVEGLDARSFFGILGPPDLPAPIRQRMETMLRDALETAEVRQRLAALGLTPAPQGGEEFGRFLAGQVATWSRVVRENGIVLE